MSSGILEYELWTRIHARGLAGTHGDLTRLLLARVARVGLREDVLVRATYPFPAPVRTLDAIHLATIAYLRQHGVSVELATYDNRMAEVARAMEVPLSALTEM